MSSAENQIRLEFRQQAEQEVNALQTKNHHELLKQSIENTHKMKQLQDELRKTKEAAKQAMEAEMSLKLDTMNISHTKALQMKELEFQKQIQEQQHMKDMEAEKRQLVTQQMANLKMQDEINDLTSQVAEQKQKQW